MGRLFGTDGVRGIANTELTGELAFQLGRAAAYVLSDELHHTPRILVGKDTRRSSDMLEKALLAGLCSSGAEAVSAGYIPTPGVAYLVRKYKFDGGVVISASHNPAEFNGIKFFNSEGYKLPDSLEERIEKIILDNAEKLPSPTGEKIGTISCLETAQEDYINHAINTVDCNFKGIKIAIDCANGAAFRVAPAAFEMLEAEVLVINNEPDGLNINRNCGSTHMNMLQDFVVNNQCAIGLAFDGDADRVLAVDENGRIIDGDRIMTILGLNLKKKGLLKDDTIVVTVMSNLGFDIMAKENGINVLKTKVGDRYVLEKMLEGDYSLGGEQSGHIILREYNTTGDGLITALQLLAVVKETGKKASELSQTMTVFPQVLRNARVTNENKYRYIEDPLIADKCKELEDLFKGEGRVLIRPSGTEPLVRVMIEGKDENYIADKADELVELIEQRLN
ncbi:MAG: phosphoglucosamine mutase [Clostridiaceae bacterium]|nr:phosphoglucosamine mutase [Clostridiaceae bacterium]